MWCILIPQYSKNIVNDFIWFFSLCSLERILEAKSINYMVIYFAGTYSKQPFDNFHSFVTFCVFLLFLFFSRNNKEIHSKLEQLWIVSNWKTIKWLILNFRGWFSFSLVFLLAVGDFFFSQFCLTFTYCIN